MSLGRCKEARLEEIRGLINRHSETLSATQSLKEIDIKETFILGPLLIIEALFKQLGLTDLLLSLSEKHPKLQFNLLKVVFRLVVSRFVEPCSKLRLYSIYRVNFILVY